MKVGSSSTLSIFFNTDQGSQFTGAAFTGVLMRVVVQPNPQSVRSRLPIWAAEDRPP